MATTLDRPLTLARVMPPRTTPPNVRAVLQAVGPRPLDGDDWRQALRDGSRWPRHRARARSRKVR